MAVTASIFVNDENKIKEENGTHVVCGGSWGGSYNVIGITMFDRTGFGVGAYWEDAGNTGVSWIAIGC